MSKAFYLRFVLLSAASGARKLYCAKPLPIPMLRALCDNEIAGFSISPAGLGGPGQISDHKPRVGSLGGVLGSGAADQRDVVVARSRQIVS